MSDRKADEIPHLEAAGRQSNRASKENSPTRLGRSLAATEQAEGSRSTSSNPSPTRPTQTYTSTTIPSAAAVQRALSAARGASSNADVLDGPKDRIHRPGQGTPSWPTSPRLKSPPPTTFKSLTARKPESDHTLPNTSIKRLAPVSGSELGAAMHVPEHKEQSQPLRTPGRGVSAQSTGLETVAESSVPTTPSIGPVLNPPQHSDIETSSLKDVLETSTESITSKSDVSHSAEPVRKSNPEKAEPQSASASASRATSNSRPAPNLAKRSLTNLASKTKAVEPMRSMTIETETVNPTSQIIGDRGRDTGGSVRTKVSNETIRPKKEKKKAPRKTPSLHAGTATSKADIFEAKVASAVDEADSSDSDETFVYESNPPEPRQGRHHSRTPSATSLASQVDHYGGRGKHGVRSGSTAIPGKKSMKFSSSQYGAQLDVDVSGGDGGRSSTRTVSSTPRHHHIGRYGRNGYASIIDTDSPFTQSNRVGSPRTPTAGLTRNSRPSSPRTSNGKLSITARKSTGTGYDTYDDGADDERAPLMGSVRVNRTRHSRRPNTHFRTLEFAEHPDTGCWPRFGGCFLMGIFVTLICLGCATFLLALNRPLADVEMRRIQNVLASDQELILDLNVIAMNQNLFAITVNDLDISLFAESPYAGTAQDWREHHPTSESVWMARRLSQTAHLRRTPFWFPPFHSDDGVDEGTDPIDDPEPGAQKMLLGRIYEFDSPLIFDPSPLRHSDVSSVGEIKLTKPGNKTELGGSIRWERVIQHPFDLIVRGVIKYQLPLSSRARSAKIGGRVKVTPNHKGEDGDGGEHKSNTTLPQIQ